MMKCSLAWSKIFVAHHLTCRQGPPERKTFGSADPNTVMGSHTGRSRYGHASATTFLLLPAVTQRPAEVSGLMRLSAPEGTNKPRGRS